MPRSISGSPKIPHRQRTSSMSDVRQDRSQRSSQPGNGAAQRLRSNSVPDSFQPAEQKPGWLGAQPQPPLDKNQKAAQAGKELIGKQKWVPGGPEFPQPNHPIPGNTDFAKWVNGKKDNLGDNSTMNCWESSLFMGHKAGVIPKSWIASAHQDATKAGEDAYQQRLQVLMNRDQQFLPLDHPLDANYHADKAYTEKLGRALNAHHAKPWDGQSEIPKGNLIFFKTYSNHTAVSLGKDNQGNHKALSLWEKPQSASSRNDAVQKTTIQALMAEMKIQDPGQIHSVRAPWESRSFIGEHRWKADVS